MTKALAPLFALLLLAATTAQGQFSFMTNGNTLTVTGYSGPGGNITIPATNDNLEVTSIMGFAFNNQTNFTNVIISDTITNIGEYAFLQCNNMTNITIPDSVTGIGMGAFVDCTGLATLTIPGSVRSLGFDAFAGCTGLASLTISNGVPSIGEDAFYYCTGLTTVMVPASVTNLADYAFESCTGLSGVYFAGAPPAADSTVFSGDSLDAVFYFTNSSGWGSSLGNVPALLWNPQIQTADGNFGVQAGRFGFDITGTANIPVVVATCTNLANPVWAPLQTNTLTNGLYYFSQPVQANPFGSFYRLNTP